MTEMSESETGATPPRSIYVGQRGETLGASSGHLVIGGMPIAFDDDGTMYFVDHSDQVDGTIRHHCRIYEW